MTDPTLTSLLKALRTTAMAQTSGEVEGRFLDQSAKVNVPVNTGEKCLVLATLEPTGASPATNPTWPQLKALFPDMPRPDDWARWREAAALLAVLKDGTKFGQFLAANDPLRAREEPKWNASEAYLDEAQFAFAFAPGLEEAKALLPEGWSLPETIDWLRPPPRPDAPVGVLLVRGKLRDAAAARPDLLVYAPGIATGLDVTGAADVWSAGGALSLRHAMSQNVALFVDVPVQTQGAVALGVEAKLDILGQELDVLVRAAEGGALLADLKFSPSDNNRAFSWLGALGLKPSALKFEAGLELNWPDKGKPVPTKALLGLTIAEWDLPGDTLKLRDCALSLAFAPGEPGAKLKLALAKFHGEAKLGALTLTAVGYSSGEGAEIALSLAPDAKYDVNKLAYALGAKGDVAAVGHCRIAKAALEYARDADGNTTFGGVLALAEVVNVNGFEITAVRLSVLKGKDGIGVEAGATAEIGGRLGIDVQLVYDPKTSKWSFLGAAVFAGRRLGVSYAAPTLKLDWEGSGGALELRDLADALGADVSSLPDGMLPALARFDLDYHGAAPAQEKPDKDDEKPDADEGRRWLKAGLRIEAARQSFDIGFGRWMEAAGEEGGGDKTPPWRWAAQVAWRPTLSLSDLPLIGGAVGDKLQLNTIAMFLASEGALRESAPKGIAADILPPEARDENDKPAPLPRRALKLDLNVAGQPMSYLLGFGDKEKTKGEGDTSEGQEGETGTPSAPSSEPKTPAPAEGAAAESGAPKAGKVERTLGPVSIKSLQLIYDGSALGVGFDAALKMSALTVGLEGLRLSVHLADKDRHLSFGLDGLSLGLKSGGLTIAGELLKIGGGFGGEISVGYGQYELTAIAAYGTDENGAASIFAFGFLEGPFGGPPFLYVTGIAGAFGVNRDLILPKIDEVASFGLVKPFVEGAKSGVGTDTKPDEALKAIRDNVPPRAGESWIAAGLRFTTCNLINSFALASVKFGAVFEVDLIGLSKLQIPPGADKPIAFAELALLASFRPDEGVLRMGAQLTRESYLFAKDCHLTGGFGLIAWFRDQGERKAGEFAVTLGGYHPAFQPPAGYPLEPRVGVNWQVDGNLTVSGGYYFALTPRMLMAGASLDAVWQSGDLRAWFSAHADFLVCWKPFHYEASIGLSIGASYHVNLWICSFDVTIHLGVDLTLHGPPFGGSVSLDLYVATITIDFGEGDEPAPALPWGDFKDNFITQQKAKPRRLAQAAALRPLAADDDLNDKDSWCHVVVSGGVLQDNSGQPGAMVDFVVNPELLCLTATTCVPAKTATWSGGNLAKEAFSFGVGPCYLEDDQFLSDLVVEIVRLQDRNSGVDTHFDAGKGLRASAAVGAFPAAAWSAKAAHDASAKVIDAAKLNDKTTTLAGVAAIVLSAQIRAETQTPPIDLRWLRVERASGGTTWAWRRPDPPAAPGPPLDPWETIDALGPSPELLGPLGVPAAVGQAAFAAAASWRYRATPRLLGLGALARSAA